MPPIMAGLVSLEDLQQYDAKLDEFYAEYRKYIEFQDAAAKDRRSNKYRDYWGLAT
jgi:hypothetical protein